VLVPAAKLVVLEGRSSDMYQAVHGILNDTYGWQVNILESAVHLQVLLMNFILGGHYD
jgi:hypothetical protein